MKTVVNFDAIFPRGARGESRRARERNESDVFQGLRNEEMEVAPFHGDREDSNFIGFDAQSF